MTAMGLLSTVRRLRGYASNRLCRTGRRRLGWVRKKLSQALASCLNSGKSLKYKTREAQGLQTSTDHSSMFSISGTRPAATRRLETARY